MKILRRVNPIKIKQAFVTAQMIRISKKTNKRYLPELTKKEFLKKLRSAKIKTNKLTEKQLDQIIAKEYLKRLKAYNNSSWYEAKASINEIGVWRSSGGLPIRWTCCSLGQTADFVRVGLARSSKRIRARSKRAIPRTLKFVNIINQEKKLFPIVFAGDTGTQGRKKCKNKMKGDIDDGCMRAIALAMKDYKVLNIYFGKPK